MKMDYAMSSKLPRYSVGILDLVFRGIHDKNNISLTAYPGISESRLKISIYWYTNDGILLLYYRRFPYTIKSGKKNHSKS